MNLITVLLAGFFLLPVLSGVLRPFSGNLSHALGTALRRLGQLAAGLLAFRLTRLLFSHPDSTYTRTLYRLVPPLEASVLGQDIWAFLLLSLILFCLLWAAFGLLAMLPRRFSASVIGAIALRFEAARGWIRRLLGGVARLPSATALVLAFSLLFHLYIGFAVNTALGDYIGASAIYRIMDKAVLEPFFLNSAAETVPSLLSSVINRAAENTALTKLTSVAYINGVTLDEAVASDETLINLALTLTKGLESDRDKGYVLYEWVCTNISYDYEKAAVVTQDSFSLTSGALEAYANGSGICFDYACLYISLCRAAGVGVRFVMGRGCSGGVWSSHAWNEIYDSASDRWLNVDATFGSSGSDCFDNNDFWDSHANAVVLGEW